MLNQNFNPYEIIMNLQHQVKQLEDNQKRLIDAVNHHARSLESLHQWQGTTNNALIFQTQTLQSILELAKTRPLDQLEKQSQ